MDPQAFFKTLSEFEGRVGEFYQWCSSVFEADPEATSVFRQLAKEERSHVSLVEFQRRLARNSPAEFADVSLDLKPVEETLAMIAEIRGAATPPSLDEALRHALAFEASAAEYHYKTAMQQAHPGTAKLLEALCTGDREHRQRLLEFARARGVTWIGSA